MSTTRAWLIDASIYIFRAWFSLPDRWRTPDGRPVHAVYGYAGFLLDFIEQTGRASYCGAAFDESLRSNFRNDFYPDYKRSRELPDDDLAFQLSTCRAITERLGIPCYGGPRYEADDYLASLARLFREREIAVTIVTRDKDLGQILRGPQDNWWDFARGELINAQAFGERFGVAPQQFPDYQALVGDPVDDIPGVPGVGAKTAARLLQSYGDLETLGKNLGSVAELPLRGARGIGERLREHWAQVLLARQLATLESRVPGVSDIPIFELRHTAVRGLADDLAGLGIAGPLLQRCRDLARELEAA